MTTNFSQEQREALVRFHGHSCPGMIIGIRATELAQRELAAPDNASDWVAVVETDMCAVDAIQFLTGCTFGKGNLIHRDWGKAAFSFYDRRSGQGFRAVLKPDARGDAGHDRTLLEQRFTDAPLEEMFEVTPLDSPPPRPARVLESLTCAACGEQTMESRTRRLGGETLCIPCFDAREQKR